MDSSRAHWMIAPNPKSPPCERTFTCTICKRTFEEVGNTSIVVPAVLAAMSLICDECCKRLTWFQKQVLPEAP